MLLMVEKCIRGGTYNARGGICKAINKYMKNCDKNIESLHADYWDVNKLYIFKE